VCIGLNRAQPGRGRIRGNKGAGREGAGNRGGIRWFLDIFNGHRVLSKHFGVPGTDALLDAGEVAIFGGGSQAGTDGIQIDVSHAGGDGGNVEQGGAFEAGFPEASFDVVFFVSGAGNEFVETTHEPAQAGQALSEFGDAFGIIDQSGDLHIGRGFELVLLVVIVREECQPAGSDFEVRPGGGDIGAGTEDEVEVVSHDGVGADIDGEDGGEMAQPVEQQGFTVREVAMSDRIEATEESAADTPAEAVIDTFLTIFDVSAARETHGSPRFNRSNGELMD